MKHEIYVVITESDGGEYLNRGALIFETYTKRSTLKDAIERAKSLENRYGRTWIGQVSIMGEVDEVANHGDE